MGRGVGALCPHGGELLRSTSSLASSGEAGGKLEGWRHKGETNVHGGGPCGVKETRIRSLRVGREFRNHLIQPGQVKASQLAVDGRAEGGAEQFPSDPFSPQTPAGPDRSERL